MQELKKIIKSISLDLRGQYKNNQKLNKEFLALSSKSINKKSVIPVLKKKINLLKAKFKFERFEGESKNK